MNSFVTKLSNLFVLPLLLLVSSRKRNFTLTKLLVYTHIFFFILLSLQPNSGLGRLHETFRFTSVTRSRTVGRTPWTDDQLIARPLSVKQTQKDAHTTQTLNIHGLSGIRIHGPGVRASEDGSCLWPLGYCDRLYTHIHVYLTKIIGHRYIVQSKNFYTDFKLSNASSKSIEQKHSGELYSNAFSGMSHGNFFLICIVGGGVQTGSTRHVGYLLAYCTCTE
jgi:hypothetical protein